jgi:hypothetical protein
VYGTSSYWWILSKFNAIEDPYNDLQVGDVIRIPAKQDVEDFYLSNKK